MSVPKTVPFAEILAQHLRTGLNQSDFAKAIFYTQSTYCTWRKRNRVPERALQLAKRVPSGDPIPLVTFPKTYTYGWSKILPGESIFISGPSLHQAQKALSRYRQYHPEKQFLITETPNGIIILRT